LLEVFGNVALVAWFRTTLYGAMTQSASAKMSCRIGLIGSQAWGRQLVAALTHQGATFRVLAGPTWLWTWAAEIAPSVEAVVDAAAAISHPEVDLLILADSLPYRSQLLLQATQLDRPVLVMHPAGVEPEVFYTVQLALEERRLAVWPLLPHRFFQGLQETAAWRKKCQVSRDWHLEATIPVPVPAGFVKDTYASTTDTDQMPFLDGHPLWFWADWLRLLGGEVAEVYAVGDVGHILEPAWPVTLTGRWEQGGDFVVRFAPHVNEGFCLQAGAERLNWQGPTVSPGEVQVRWQTGSRDENRCLCEESIWDRIAGWILRGETSNLSPPTWADAVACAELVQATVESLRSRKTVPLLHQEYTGPAVFKSRAATLGCGAVWVILGLVMLAPLLPQALYLVPIMLLACLVMFVLGWLAYRRSD